MSKMEYLKNGAAGDDDVACTLDRLFDVGGYDIDECAATALKAY